MHLAFVTSLVVDGKPTTGFEVANQAIVTNLRAIGVRVSVVGFKQRRQILSDDPDLLVLKTLDVENDGAGMAQKISWLLKAILSGLPVGGSKLQVLSWPELRARLSDLGDLDGVIINSVQMPTAFPQLLDFAPFIYVAHNVEHQSARQNATTSQSLVKRWFYARDARLLQPIEEELCARARYVFCLSEDDRKTLALDDKRSGVLPMIFSDFSPETSDKSQSGKLTRDVGLIGSWTWQPNLVGLQWFLREVVPHLEPGIKISVAGNIPTLATADYPAIEFVGRVANAEQFVNQSRLLALVAQSGTGVQLKTIEAFQMGMPCVASLSSVRGIAKIPANCRVEEDPKKFAAALNTTVELVRSGEIGRLDGKEFGDAQLRGLRAALQQGVESLGAPE